MGYTPTEQAKVYPTTFEEPVNPFQVVAAITAQIDCTDARTVAGGPLDGDPRRGLVRRGVCYSVLTGTSGDVPDYLRGFPEDLTSGDLLMEVVVPSTQEARGTPTSNRLDLAVPPEALDDVTEEVIAKAIAQFGGRILN